MMNKRGAPSRNAPSLEAYLRQIPQSSATPDVRARPSSMNSPVAQRFPAFDVTPPARSDRERRSVPADSSARPGVLATPNPRTGSDAGTPSMRTSSPAVIRNRPLPDTAVDRGPQPTRPKPRPSEAEQFRSGVYSSALNFLDNYAGKFHSVGNAATGAATDVLGGLAALIPGGYGDKAAAELERISDRSYQAVQPLWNDGYRAVIVNPDQEMQETLASQPNKPFAPVGDLAASVMEMFTGADDTPELTSEPAPQPTLTAEQAAFVNELTGRCLRKIRRRSSFWKPRSPTSRTFRITLNCPRKIGRALPESG